MLVLLAISDTICKLYLRLVSESQYIQDHFQAYVSVYLTEEIRNEGLVRNLSGFSRFLTIAGISNGEMINQGQNLRTGSSRRFKRPHRFLRGASSCSRDCCFPGQAP